MTKIDIISGFLGSGKTTLIKKLLDETLFHEKVVVIENEFGELGIDGAILKKSGIEIRELYSGCICCSLAGDFENTIQEVLHKFQPERIMIEPSGVAKLSEIIKACEIAALKEALCINMLITVVDVLKFEIYLTNFGEFFENQIAFAKTILLTRTEKVSTEALEQVILRIRKINEKGSIVTTPLESLKAEKILCVAEGDGSTVIEKLMQDVLVKREACRGPHIRSHEHHREGCACGQEHEHYQEGCSCGHDHKHKHDNCGCNHTHQHNADEIFEVWGMETPRVFCEETLKNNLAMLEDESNFGMILRGKGFLQVDGAWVQFDYTPGEIQIRMTEPDYTGKICIIGSKLNKNALEKLFQAAE